MHASEASNPIIGVAMYMQRLLCDTLCAVALEQQALHVALLSADTLLRRQPSESTTHTDQGTHTYVINLNGRMTRTLHMAVVLPCATCHH
jgi:hypothetical protein